MLQCEDDLVEPLAPVQPIASPMDVVGSGIATPVPSEPEQDHHVWLYQYDDLNTVVYFEKCASAELEPLDLKSPELLDLKSPEMRSNVIEWLVGLAKAFKLKPDTLFLSVSLVERFLEVKKVQRQQLRLVAATGLVLATKFEETNDEDNPPPQLQDFVRMSSGAYSTKELMQMEATMLTALNFRLFQRRTLHFLPMMIALNLRLLGEQGPVADVDEISMASKEAQTGGDYEMARQTPWRPRKLIWWRNGKIALVKSFRSYC